MIVPNRSGFEMAERWNIAKQVRPNDGTASFYAQAAIELLKRSIPKTQEGTLPDIEAMLPKSTRGVPRKERKHRNKLDEYAK